MVISAFVFTIALGFYAKLYLPRNLIVSEKDHDYFTGKYLQYLLKGWYVLKNEGRILLLIIPLAVTNLFYGIASVGMPYFSSQYLTKSAISYGGLELFSSIGGLLGSLIVSKIDTLKPNLEQLIVICLGLAGISVVLEALVANYIPGLILIFALSSAFWISIMNINFEVLIQESFSPRILGRIEAINSSIINCMMIDRPTFWSRYCDPLTRLSRGTHSYILFNILKIIKEIDTSLIGDCQSLFSIGTMIINHSPSYYYRLPKLARLVTINMYTVKQRGGKLMKVKLNIR